MKLFVGLGNPGPPKYAGNRHNIGFMALDCIAEDHGFAPPWRGKFQGSMTEGRLGGREKVLLLKPETFMNLSGQSVGEAMRFYKLTPPADVTVFHDELDLAPGKVRLKQGGGGTRGGTTGSARSTSISGGPSMRGCGWALAIRATRTPYRATCCAISPRRNRIGWMI